MLPLIGDQRRISSARAELPHPTTLAIPRGGPCESVSKVLTSWNGDVGGADASLPMPSISHSANRHPDARDAAITPAPYCFMNRVARFFPSASCALIT
jgi:hypothetical protein